MALFDTLKQTFARNNNRNTSSRNNESTTPPQPELGGGRTSASANELGSGVFGALPRKAKRELALNDRTLNNSTIFELIDSLIDAHPDLSYALWNFMRLGNSGYSYTVTKLDSDDEYPEAKKDIDDLLRRFKTPNMVGFERSRDLHKIIDQLILLAVTRGALAGELVLTPDKKDVSRIVLVDPATIEFNIVNGRYIPSQDDGRISLDIPTFFYEGIDEKIDDPYGRSPIISALNMVLFQMQVLNDIKAVVHNQGYPRLDLVILEEVLLKRMPISIRNNEVKKEEWLRARLNEIIVMYNSLNPDDVFVHFDSLKIGEAGGKGGALIDPQSLMHVIDNLIQSGVKTLSTLLGRRGAGQTESYAKVEIKLYLAGLGGIQKYITNFIERMLTVYLNIKGKQGIVNFKFKPIEIRSELEQQQFEATRLNNIAMMYDRGWISQETAAKMAVGQAPDAPAPRVAGASVRNADGSPVSGTTDTNPRAGGNTDNSGN
jgi:hypothetical protein